MEMVLLDWTRMGKYYCLAGAVVERDCVRVVRPLLARNRNIPIRNTGWTPWTIDGHNRWDAFELVGPEPAKPEPPHLEDLWVRTLSPCRRSAPKELRTVILRATAAESADALFGEPLATTRACAYLAPGRGTRSLGTLLVPSRDIRFHAGQRVGAGATDVRVTLGPDRLGGRQLPVKDHTLLRKAEAMASTPAILAQLLDQMVRLMGGTVAVRLGLSRAFQGREGEAGQCWVMADGFFSLDDPQP